MKGTFDHTKVVLRHLPPSISKAMLTDQIERKFSGRYNWLSFVPGNSSQKHVVHSRAYINFNRAEDVIDFAEFFGGHVFVNEKGAQYKAIVEYAPSQRVPKQWSTKDGREGTIFKDPEYMEFLEFLGKPVEHLPSAEIQLERREAEQAAAGKEALIITPLMDFVRQKRAANNGSRQKLLSNGKSMRRTGRQSSGSPVAVSSKRSERRRITTNMYVMRDTAKATSGKNRSADSLPSKREDQLHTEKSVASECSAGDELSIDKSGRADIGKKRILLLKGKERDISHAKLSSKVNVRPNTRRETSGRIIRNMLQPERQIQSSKAENDRQSQPSNVLLFSKSRNGLLDDKSSRNDIQMAEKSERCMRNKERPDRIVWTPLRRSDGAHANDEALSSASQSMQMPPSLSEGSHGEKADISARIEVKVIGTACSMHSSIDNGFLTHARRRKLPSRGKDSDGTLPEGKSARRGVSSSYDSHEV